MACEQLRVDDLKALLGLVQGPAVQGRKEILVNGLVKFLEDPKQVRSLYDGLDDLSKKAVQEATHEEWGVLHERRFQAKYGKSPIFSKPGRSAYHSHPTELRLFFIDHRSLPTDLRETLLTFVPEPPPLKVAALDELPAQVPRPHTYLGEYYRKPDTEEVELRVRETDRSALQDIQAVLRLVDAGEVRVSDKTHRPTQAAQTAIVAVLADGEFYGQEDRADYREDPGHDLTIKAFAWPLLLQAAGLVQLAGTRLELSAAGRKATSRPMAEMIRLAWNKWLKTTLLDEFSRINVIKGQQSKGKGGLTAVAPRRSAIVQVLSDCPPGKWIKIEELFRLLRASDLDFSISRNSWKLYISMPQYGHFADRGESTWQLLEGRYLLAFLFEYVATLGLVDVAYISPVRARNDLRLHWGTDDYSCLSRYDGLLYVRINPLGAWCLGLAPEYKPAPVAVRRILRVLPNLDVVASDPPLGPAEALLLDRFAERTSEAVWHLTAAKILAAVEEGLTVAELTEFLNAKSLEPLPQNVEVFLTDLENKANQLEDLGTARLLSCADGTVAMLLANDRRLRALCQLAGDRQLVFRAGDEKAVRRALRELGYVLPPPR